ncbi:MAG: M48 family metallopeptidase [Ignavibacteriae bacterium]|nr:M48 family metallopeptidase [Ignavibacteriota bacterium]
MNLFGWIILVALVVEYILHLIADYLNINTLHQELPTEFEGVFDVNAYRKSQQYTKVKITFGILTSTISFFVTLAFWFSSGFSWLDGIVHGWGLPSIWTGLLYIGTLILFRTMLSLPFSIYSTFVIEERFGFNKTTPSTFVTDLIKGLLLAIVLGGPLLSGILALFEYTGPSAWLYCWMITILFTLFIQFVAPTWIMPLFNKFIPLADGELKQAIMSLAEQLRFPLQGVYVMDGSKRSSKTNAFFTGFGKNKRIAMFDTLIAKHTVSELVAVLAHEIGHYKKKHIIQGIVISNVHLGVMFLMFSFFINNEALFDAFFMEHVSIYASLIFFGMLYSPAEFIISIFLHLLSRKNEYEADQFAAETVGQPETMIEALKKLSLDNLSHLTPHPFYVWLNHSHPPVLERIKAIRSYQRN